MEDRVRLLEDRVRSLEEQLKQQGDECDMMRFTFQQSPIPMGTLEFFPDWEDAVWGVTNEVARAAIQENTEPAEYPTVFAPYTPEQKAFFIKHYREAERTGQTVWFEYTHKGERHSVLSVKHMRGRMFAWSVQDITELKNLQSQLQKHESELKELVELRTRELAEALECKSKFVATISHELRTPLNGVSGYLEILQHSRPTEEQRQSIENATVCCEHLLRVVSDVLDFTRMEQNKLEIKNECYNVRDTIQAALRVCQIDAQRQVVEIVCEMGAEVPDRMYGDADRVRQVLVNLLSNAIKHARSYPTQAGRDVLTTSKARVLLGAHAADSQLTLFVRDYGPGIPEDKRGSVFQPFSQLDRNNQSREGGFGLGLNICQNLAALMRGRLWFDTEEGRGTTFYFSLPISESCDQPEATHTHTTQPTSTHPLTSAQQVVEPDWREIFARLRVLVADDEHTNVTVAVRMLQTLGCKRVDSVWDGHQAVAAASANHVQYDVIFMDSYMPVMCGTDAAKCIRQALTEKHRRQPLIVAVTGDTQPGSREQYLEAGMDDVLVKPIHMQDLRKVLQTAAEHERTAEAY